MVSEKTIIAARAAAESLLDDSPTLAEHPLLQAQVTTLEESAQAEFLEKS